jgi:hypothetical protein
MDQEQLVEVIMAKARSSKARESYPSFWQDVGKCDRSDLYLLRSGLTLQQCRSQGDRCELSSNRFRGSTTPGEEKDYGRQRRTVP